MRKIINSIPPLNGLSLKGTVIVIIILSLNSLAFSANTENSLLGKWKDKTHPDIYHYEFLKSQDFVFTYTWNEKGIPQKDVKKGVWEMGQWEITSPSGIKSRCNLTIYADTVECCFDYKFISGNLIITNRYKSDSFTLGMCENRVLIKE